MPALSTVLSTNPYSYVERIAAIVYICEPLAVESLTISPPLAELLAAIDTTFNVITKSLAVLTR